MDGSTLIRTGSRKCNHLYLGSRGIGCSCQMSKGLLLSALTFTSATDDTIVAAGEQIQSLLLMIVPLQK